MMLREGPFFCFYGGKWRAAPRYPKPVYDTIIEPFAGAAGYSTRYAGRKVFLYDVDPVIVGVWSYLINVSVREMLMLPDLQPGQTTRDLKVCDEARALIGWWLNKGSAQPKLRPSSWMKTSRTSSYWGPVVRERLARQCEQIRHWKVDLKTWSNVPNQCATWFIDPPYQHQGKYYRCADVNFIALGSWCKTRRGQVLVCEQGGADWLPFQVQRKERGMRDTYKDEVLWVKQ